MEQNMQGSSNSSKFIMFAGLAFAVLSATIFAISQAGNVEISTGNATDWTLTTEGTNGFDQFGLSAALAASSAPIFHDPASFGLPDPSGKCGDLEKITGAPCQWEVEERTGAEGQRIFSVRLKSGNIQVAEFQGMEVDLAAYPELGHTSFWGMAKGWITHIQVADWLQGLGFGRLMWEVGDKVMKTAGGGQATHIFVDHAGWASALLANMQKITQVAQNIYLYVIQ